MSEQLAAELKKKRRYQCTTCNKAFSRPSALRTHIYTHTGEKPFECTTPGCGRRFAVISNLRRHFKVHRKVVHASRIPASERLRQVQRLIERTAPPEPYPMQYAMPDQPRQPQHQHQQYCHHHHHDHHQQQHKSPSPLIPVSGEGCGVVDHHSFYRHYQYAPYGPPLTPAAGNSIPTLSPSSSSTYPSSYFKSAPKAPFIVMSDVTQQQQHHHHISHHYREPSVFHFNQQPHSSFGQA